MSDKVLQMIRTIRVKDGEAIPVDVSIDFRDEGGTNGNTIFFELEQESSVFLSLEGIKAVWSAASRLEADFKKFIDKGRS